MRKLLLVLLLTFLVSTSHQVNAAPNINNFHIHDYQIEYYLGRDSEGRSTLKTIETISAQFPEFNQNHGLERAIPTTYDGHSTSLKIESVTNEAGVALEYNDNKVNDYIVLRIGDPDKYVHGLQQYKITYTQRDVTKFFADTGRDEFYWDTNGVDWAVPISLLTVRLHLADELRTRMKSDPQAYVGLVGATKKVPLERQDDGVMARVSDLKANENLTLAVGFSPETFMPYKMSVAEIIFAGWLWVNALLIPVALTILIWILVRYYQRSNRTAEIGTIIPEYLPPKDISVSVAGSITDATGRVLSAQLIDFAVRHYIKIYQTREKSLFKSANYELEIIKDISPLTEEEQEIFHDLFENPTVGARLDMETLPSNTRISKELSDNKKKVDASIASHYGLRAFDRLQSAWFHRIGVIVLVAGILTLSPSLLIVSVVIFVCAATIKPLTDSGLALARYLKGLKLYISVAETERLRMLQSPDGAAKLDNPLDANDTWQLIKLYERVLPYAILFGQEKQWNDRLGKYYQSAGESPSWFASNNAVFNAVVFSSALNNFNSVAAHSDPTNASSGGSSGGGSSGGGGGGGGGGGW